MKAIYGFLSWILIKATKKIVPGFIHVLNCGDLEELLTKGLQDKGVTSENVNFACIDGSSHDSHQHIELIDKVDTSILNSLSDTLLGKLPMFTQKQKKKIHEGLGQRIYKFQAKYAFKDHPSGKP